MSRLRAGLPPSAFHRTCLLLQAGNGRTKNKIRRGRLFHWRGWLPCNLFALANWKRADEKIKSGGEDYLLTRMAAMQPVCSCKLESGGRKNKIRRGKTTCWRGWLPCNLFALANWKRADEKIKSGGGKLPVGADGCHAGPRKSIFGKLLLSLNEL